jgi:hypothetical protein
VTMPADRALLAKHLSSARGHVESAVCCLERLSGNATDAAVIEALYEQRAELKRAASTLAHLSARCEAQR